jgi:hypothetical protein
MSAAAAKRTKEKPAKKCTAKQKADPPQPADDQEIGLWVDWDFLRSLTKRPPQTIVHGTTREEDSRYLQLADVVLRPEERRKKKRGKPSKIAPPTR